MSLTSIKSEVENILAANAINNTWDDILKIFDDELRSLIFAGSREDFVTALEAYYENVDFSSLNSEVTDLINFEQVINPDPAVPVYFKCTGSVAPDGTLEQGSGCTTSLISTGRYNISFNTPALTTTYPVLMSSEIIAGTNDYMFFYTNRTVNDFEVQVRSQDDGGSGGTLRNIGFSVFVPNI